VLPYRPAGPVAEGVTEPEALPSAV